MHLNELFENEDSGPMPHIFLDMDGVQADFETPWANLLGVPSIDHIKNRDEGIKILSHSSADEVYEFFKNLDPLPGGKELVNWLKFSRLPYTILSAPLRGPYSAASVKGKKEWLRRYNPGTAETAMFTDDKYKHAMDGGRANVLIDDYDKQIDAWTKAGGIAIKHVEGSTQSTIEQLKKVFAKYLSPNGIMYAKIPA
jgi:hypothetical protein